MPRDVIPVVVVLTAYENAVSKNVILHIGLPKTGSTSLQYLLGENRLKLRRQNADYFLGSLSRNRFNHGELYLSVLRDGVTTFGTQKFHFDKSVLKQRTMDRIGKFVTRAKAKTLLFSAEGLSFLRTEDELRNLRQLFPPNVSFKIFLVERPADRWLESWRRQIVTKSDRTLSSDPNSALYAEEDSWLVDFEELRKVYREQFGDLTTFQFRRQGLLEEILCAAGLDLDVCVDRYRYKERQVSTVKPSLLRRNIDRLNRTLSELDYWLRYE